MVDTFNSPEVPPVMPDGSGSDGSQPTEGRGFLATTAGRLVVGGIVVFVLLSAVGAIFVLFVMGGTTGSREPIAVAPASGESTGGASAETLPTERPAEDFADTFVFRNIFQPTIKVTVPTSSDDDGSGTDDGDGDGVEVPQDTLFLSSVETVDGEPTANLVWNGQTYSVTEGETITGTPWEVLSISGDTVVMLYGDTRVTLVVGQGVAK